MREAIAIEAATRGDLDAIHRIERESFPEPWRREFFESELAADRRLSLVAKREGDVVGYLFAMWLFEELHVNKIAVAASERRKGIADALMARCIDFARLQSVETVSLEVRRTNDEAHAFYRHLGFTVSYVRPHYYPDGEAALVMVRKLE